MKNADIRQKTSLKYPQEEYPKEMALIQAVHTSRPYCVA